MLIKLTSLREGEPASRSRGWSATRARAPSTWPASSSRRSRRDPPRASRSATAWASTPGPRPASCTPRPASGRGSRVEPGRPHHGRQVDPGHPAPGRLPGHGARAARPRETTRRPPWRPSPPSSRAASGRRPERGAARAPGSRRASRWGRPSSSSASAAPVFRLLVPPEQVEREVQRLTRAVEASREQLQAIKERLSREVGVPHAYIFDAHLLMLEDPLLLRPRGGRDPRGARERGVGAAHGLRAAPRPLRRVHRRLPAGAQHRPRRRAGPHPAQPGGGRPTRPPSRGCPGTFVLVAADLTPSEAAELDWERVLAVVTDAGSSTYHTAILARSLGIPAVVGLRGRHAAHPARAAWWWWTARRGRGGGGALGARPRGLPGRPGARAARGGAAAGDARPRPRSPCDGVAVRLAGQRRVPRGGGDRARSTGPRASASSAPSTCWAAAGAGPRRSEQVDVYRRLLEQMRPHPVTVRTWDVGLEELAPGGPVEPQPGPGRAGAPPPAPRPRALPDAAPGPAAGRRSTARCASCSPSSAGPADLRLALDLLERGAGRACAARASPFARGRPGGPEPRGPERGPRAPTSWRRDVDFFSIGTNDLIQYLLAVDRTDPRVSALYQPLHPAVLRTLRRIVAAAAAHGRPRLGLRRDGGRSPRRRCCWWASGFRDLSMTPSAIPRVKAALRAVRAAGRARGRRACLSLAHGRRDRGAGQGRRWASERRSEPEPTSDGRLAQSDRPPSSSRRSTCASRGPCSQYARESRAVGERRSSCDLGQDRVLQRPGGSPRRCRGRRSRRTGASRYSKSSSAMRAAISAP